jgi:autotransporter-associated beta strand protein
MAVSVTGGSNSPVVSLAGSSSVEVDSSVTLTVGLAIGNSQSGTTSLIKAGGGTLVLSGSNTFTGGVDVQSGTLIVNSVQSLPSGTSLTVGASADSIFAASTPLGATPSVVTVPVPEPGALVLLVAAGTFLLLYRIGTVVSLGYSGQTRTS